MSVNSQKGICFHLCLIINTMKTLKHISLVISELSEKASNLNSTMLTQLDYHERFRPIFTANPEL